MCRTFCVTDAKKKFTERKSRRIIEILTKERLEQHMTQWLDNAVFYEIYPQSFQDTNADGIGDLQGIISRLDYICELGCNAIWINPCFTSPFGDAGYDVADYYTIAPRYGTNEDAKQLFFEAHKRGMHVLLDLVPGHTSTEHRWFKESVRDEKNAFSDRYIWTDSVWEAPENMGCLRGISDRDGSVALNFFSMQPALNYGFYKITRPWQQSPDDEGPKATLAAMMDVMRFWLSMGCDGFRVDMAGSLVKNDEDGKGTIALWKKVRAMLDKEYPQAVLVSEWGEPDKSLQGGFHMDFLLHFGPSHYNDLFRCEHPFFSSAGKGDASAFVEKYLDSYVKSERKGLICIPSGNHDMDRLARSLTPDEIKVAFGFLLSMPGAPFIYYGDEIGMRYVEGLTSVEGGYNRTGSRSPMQWDSSANNGFSSASPEKLYIKMDADPERPTVIRQLARKDSIYHTVKDMIGVRQEHTALQSRAGIDFVCAAPHTYPLAYTRSSEDETILVIINPSAVSQRFESDLPGGETIYSLGGEAVKEGAAFVAPPCSVNYILL